MGWQPRNYAESFLILICWFSTPGDRHGYAGARAVHADMLILGCPCSTLDPPPSRACRRMCRPSASRLLPISSSRRWWPWYRVIQYPGTHHVGTHNEAAGCNARSRPEPRFAGFHFHSRHLFLAPAEMRGRHRTHICHDVNHVARLGAKAAAHGLARLRGRGVGKMSRIFPIGRHANIHVPVPVSHAQGIMASRSSVVAEGGATNMAPASRMVPSGSRRKRSA